MRGRSRSARPYIQPLIILMRFTVCLEPSRSSTIVSPEPLFASKSLCSPAAKPRGMSYAKGARDSHDDAVAGDWLGPVTTLVAGAIGVVGTLLAARQGRQAQIELARQGAVQSLRAEKRALYGKLLVATSDQRFVGREFNLLTATGRELAAATGTVSPDRADNLLEGGLDVTQRVADNVRELDRLIAEIEVVGGPDMGSLASCLVSASTMKVNAAGTSADARIKSLAIPVHRIVTTAMHADIDPTERDPSDAIRNHMLEALRRVEEMARLMPAS